MSACPWIGKNETSRLRSDRDDFLAQHHFVSILGSLGHELGEYMWGTLGSISREDLPIACRPSVKQSSIENSLGRCLAVHDQSSTQAQERWSSAWATAGPRDSGE